MKKQKQKNIVITTVEQFTELKLGESVYSATIEGPRDWRYAGISPDGMPMLRSGSSARTIKTVSKYELQGGYAIFYTHYRRSCREALKLAQKNVKAIRECYIKYAN